MSRTLPLTPSRATTRMYTRTETPHLPFPPIPFPPLVWLTLYFVQMHGGLAVKLRNSVTVCKRIITKVYVLSCTLGSTFPLLHTSEANAFFTSAPTIVRVSFRPTLVCLHAVYRQSSRRRCIDNLRHILLSISVRS
mmetsp:Transcript_33712/g.86446  ORF Transcript_33712/g.86446 Transcript_33712/m.86446 type:complete len:136 (+) Transcript_33712:1186-1593(+)